MGKVRNADTVVLISTIWPLLCCSVNLGMIADHCRGDARASVPAGGVVNAAVPAADTRKLEY